MINFLEKSSVPGIQLITGPFCLVRMTQASYRSSKLHFYEHCCLMMFEDFEDAAIVLRMAKIKRVSVVLNKGDVVQVTAAQ